MADLENAQSEVIEGLKNRTVIGKVLSQIDYDSKVLPHINVIDVDGDVIKIVGLKSNEPIKWAWDYKKDKFGPDKGLDYQGQITNDDKWIFHTTFSQPIEKLVFGDGEKLQDALVKQGKKVASDAAEFLDNDFVQNFACERDNYKIITELGPTLMKDVKAIGELVLTTGYDMTRPSESFNQRGEKVNVKETKKLLCFVNTSLIARMEVSSDFGTPSPVLTALEKRFVVIPINMENKCQVALIDSDALYLARAITDRLLEHDKYVNCHKILDHLWRKWIMVDYRPAWAIFSKDTD